MSSPVPRKEAVSATTTDQHGGGTAMEKRPHSEYKSTFRWHEFTPRPQDLVASAVASAAAVVVKKAPQPRLDDIFSFSRKKKHPDVAYRSHEFFDLTLAPPFPTRNSNNSNSITFNSSSDALDGGGRSRASHRRMYQVASSSSTDNASAAALRRTRSEGPRGRSQRTTTRGGEEEEGEIEAQAMTTSTMAISAGAESTASSATPPSSTARKTRKVVDDPEHMVSSFPPPAPSSKWNLQENQMRQKQMKESASMSQLQAGGGKIVPGSAVPIGITGGSGEGPCGHSEPRLNGEMGWGDETRYKRDFRSEYRVCYRPFSQFEYLDGHFIESPRDDNIVAVTAATASSTPNRHGQPWYKEVVELRKQANDYKCRGWGTDLAPPHINELYRKQMELQEQATKRESLSALSLAFATPRPTQYGDLQPPPPPPSSSSTLPRASHHNQRRLSRPGTAPPNAYQQQTLSSSARGSTATTSTNKQAEGQRPKKPSNRSLSTSRPVTAARARSPVKHQQRPSSARPPSASTATPLSHSPAPAPPTAATTTTNGGGGWKVHKEATAAPDQQRRQRPTTLNTSSASQIPEFKIRRNAPAPHQFSGRQGPLQQNVKAMAKAPSAVAAAAVEGISAQKKRLSRPTTASTTNKRTDLHGHAPASQQQQQQQHAHQQQHQQQQQHQPPTAAVRRPFSRGSSAHTGGSSRPPSAIENHLDYFREPVVKSPPEPTRVRSPEGSVRSPDPINWTVPLDTGKTFSVTHGLKEGDLARGDSPLLIHSDHSSGGGVGGRFDSVSGVAINLGGGSSLASSSRGSSSERVAGGGGAQQPKISSLAKDAKTFQPGFTRDSTVTRPVLPSSGANASKNESASNEKRPLPSERNSNSNAVNGSNNNSTKPAATAPGTSSLKCLDDPSFLFDASSSSTSAPVPKKPMYKVLEDPFEVAELVAPATSQGPSQIPRAAPRAPINDPMLMGMYDASTSSDARLAAAGGSPNIGGRPGANEVLEGAREKFDKFWSKSSPNKEMDN